MTYFPRALENSVKEALSLMPAVFLNGPRQAGKSTLVQHISAQYLHADYVTFDNTGILAAAAHDPEGFLRSFTKPVVIDEVQLVPEIFRVLKLLIDEYRLKDKKQANGRFLLTGSANILALPSLSDALVGRMAVLSLYPLSANETLGQGGPIMDRLFNEKIGFKQGNQAHYSIAQMIRQATFPEISHQRKINYTLWFESYLTTLLQRDVRQLAEIEKIQALPNILRLLAVRAGGLLNDADCARDAGLNAMTYSRYRVLLEQLFLITLVPPWYRNIGKRLVKAPKLFLVDTLLLCHLLGVELESLKKENPHLFGHVLENFVASELMKQLAATSDGKLYHFRSHDHKEVDFLIERRNGQIIAIEVKSSASVNSDDFAGLRFLKEHLGKDFVCGIVLYLGKDVLPFGKAMLAMPMSSFLG